MDLKQEGYFIHPCWLGDGEVHMSGNADGLWELKIILAEEMGTSDLLLQGTAFGQPHSSLKEHRCSFFPGTSG